MTVRAAAAFDEFLSHARQSHTWPRTNLYKTKRPKAFGLAQWLLPADNPLVAHTAELPPNPCLRCVTSDRVHWPKWLHEGALAETPRSSRCCGVILHKQPVDVF
ncbi:unnamed protein product [Durusdinium trenchii]|uniref:Uncharacterized protein n=1 Tax=Durusdinium trenchii TaxID=1381693 RepID=A0ABP0KBV8_9DINO